MFDLFGFDPKKLTDDELLTKTTELQAKIVYASRFSSVELLASLQRFLQVIEMEQQERLSARFHEEQRKLFPDVIESDPDLAGKNTNNDQPERGKIVPQPRPRMQITKTSRPAGPGEPGEQI